jgi:uncharacterized protein YndB with AHSA1/START domain
MGHAWEQHDEAVVAGTVEDVWAAIATGPGIDSWFMGRNQVEPGSDGWIATDLGGSVRPAEQPDLLPDASVAADAGGFVMTSSVTAWDPPHRFGYRSQGPGEQFMAAEYLIEGRDQGGAVVRLVTSGFLPGDDWESEFEAMTAGGQMYFGTLTAYLDHFAGRFATPINFMGAPVEDWPAAWTALRTRLGLSENPVVGDAVQAAVPGLPALSGEVDFVNSQALGVRTADGLYRFVQGFFGGFFVNHHIFADIDEKQTAEAWLAWAASL